MDLEKNSGRITIIGAGAWGTALAIHVARLGIPVRLWVREEDVLFRLRSRRDNPRYLPGVPVPQGVEPTGSLEEAAADADLVLTVVPTPFARDVYGKLRAVLPPETHVVVAAKGIESETLALPMTVAAETIGGERQYAVISGPSFADEVGRGVPTALVVASASRVLALRVQDALSGDTVRFYTNDDVVGVQIAGALKNVIAIAAGVVGGLGLGANTTAALVTRGIAEIRRLGIALGGRAETFSGLAGLGDLVLTCTGELSRNRKVGLGLGRGERLDDILSTTVHVAEGVRTARSARALAAAHGVEMPIVSEVCRLLDDETSPAEAVRRLMRRPLVPEEVGPGEELP